MKTFNLVVSYNGNAETWDEIRNDAENEKIKNVFIGTKEFVSVVRCKDCKWQSTVHDADDNSNYYMCGVHAQPTDPYAFCSWGERRSE